MGEYAVLAILGYTALCNSSKQRAAFSFVFLLALLYALSDEFHQSFVPNRDPSFWDVGLDALGAALGLLLVKLVYPLLKREGKS